MRKGNELVGRQPAGGAFQSGIGFIKKLSWLYDTPVFLIFSLLPILYRAVRELPH